RHTRCYRDWSSDVCSSDLGNEVNAPRIRFAETRTELQKPETWASRATKHPFFAWAGLRAPIAQHTAAEHQALERHARGRKSLVEIGRASCRERGEGWGRGG